ncbi:MAG: aminopeptidase P N-terminal domain-containing protein [Clostridia bacterium]|nr:aminopeptidase P N-terminal domain-containing protein [Clostridia bacterium]
MNKSFYKKNRKKLFARLEDEACMVILSSGYSVTRSADENYPFQVNSNFFYLTGVTQEKVHLVLLKKGEEVKELLYIDEFDEQHAKWIGHRLTKKEAAALSGVAVSGIRYITAFEKDIADFAKEYPVVYLDLETNRNFNFNSFGLSMAKKFENDSAVEVKNIYEAIITLRSAKDKYEVEEIKKAIAVTAKGIDALMKNARPGMKEYQLEAYFDFVLKSEGQHDFAFTTIAASGGNATTLHYSSNDSVMQDGDLILFDLGAKSGGYSADISRTFPVNGKFSPLQRTIYEIVLAANKKICKVAKAGMTMGELQAITVDVLADGCLKAGLIKTREEIKRVYFHGVSHSLGLDTHDPMPRGIPLPVGAVITNEPGLYFPEHNIGIRIEDDLYLLKNKAINLSADIIKEVDEIEAFMAENK